MSLLIRHDPAEHVLRSVGAAPHGILCVCVPYAGATWAIDGSYQPPTVNAPGITIDSRPTAGGMGPDSTPVNPDEVVEACQGIAEAQALLTMLNGYLTIALDMATRTLTYELLVSHCDLAAATRDALERHGYLRRTEAT